MIKKAKIFFGLLKRTYLSWDGNDPFGKSAVVAYYTLFSLPSLLMIVASIAGYFFGREAVRGRIVDKVSSLIGEGVSEAIEGMIASATLNDSSMFTVILGIAMLIFGATGVFVRLKRAMNDIWEVEDKKNNFIRLILERVNSFGMVVVIGFLFLVSLVLSLVLNTLSEYLERIAPKAAAVFAFILSFIITFLVITGLFAALFKLLPDKKIRWKVTFLGAGLTTALFLLGEYALGYYFTTSNPTSVYGGASSIVLILLWVYYTCLIMFFGAEFTKQYAMYFSEKDQKSEIISDILEENYLSDNTSKSKN